MRHIQFRISRWEKTLIFQMIGTDTTFWTSMTTLIPGGYYTASNGLRVNCNTTASNISTYTGTPSQITISNKFNVTSCAFSTDALRDAAYDIVVAALKELVIYVLNNGSLPQICINCFNYRKPTSEYWCYWIIQQNTAWNGSVDKCSHFNDLYSDEEHFEMYDI